MLKGKALKVFFLIVTTTFCLKTNGISEGSCPPPYDCPPNLSTIQGTVQYEQDWYFIWDPNNPQEINRNSSLVIKVIGGQVPYKWSVTGDGFSLSDDQTQGLSNTLIADDTACGSAVVTVTDSRNSPQVGGSVRTLDYGQWVHISQTCEMPGAPTTPWIDQGWGLWKAEKIAGGRKQTTKIFNYSGFGNCDLEEENCSEDDGENGCAASCSVHFLCWKQEGCNECLTPPAIWPTTLDPCGVGSSLNANKVGQQAWETGCVFCEAYDRYCYSGVCSCINSWSYYEYQCN